MSRGCSDDQLRRRERVDRPPAGAGGRRALDVEQSAQYFNTSVRFVRRLIAERRIVYHKVGAHIRIAVADLDAFMAATRVDPITRESVLDDMRGVA